MTEDNSRLDIDNYPELDNVPVTVGMIEIKGLRKTKSDFLEPLISPCFQAKTFGALATCIRASVDSIQQLDIFKNINVILDSHQTNEDKAGSNELKIVIEGEEKRYRLHAGTELQKNDIGLTLQGKLFNVGGRAETLDISASLGQHTSAPLNISFSKPLQADPRKLFSLSIHSSSSTHPQGARYSHSNAGISASLKLPSTIFHNASHEFSFVQDWRRIYGIKDDASPSIRRSAGHSLKSALNHQWTVNTRDDMAFPTTGHYLRWSQELAGLFGDVNHLKNDLFASLHFPLLTNLASLSLSCHVGHLLPIGTGKTFIIDRFQMGGPTSVRGFNLNSLGPRDQEDSLGGDLALEAGASISFPFTSGTSSILRGHLFSNIGWLGSCNSAFSLKDNLKTFAASPPSVSLGGGLLFRLSPSARLELNLTYPILGDPHTKAPHKGLQLGLGIEFL